VKLLFTQLYQKIRINFGRRQKETKVHQMIRASQRNAKVLLTKSLTFFGEHGEIFVPACRFFQFFHIPKRKMAFTTRNLIFRQLFEPISSTYTYILGCPKTQEAIIIDPVVEMVDRDIKLLTEIGLKLKFTANTHCHADHVTGTGEMKRKMGGNLKSVISGSSGAKADVHVAHGDKVRFGEKELEVRATPGHTDGCIVYVLHSDRMAFTGDTLMIRACGRTDFQQGCPARLYESVHEQIFTLPADFLLYPAHDYKGQTVTTVDEEKRLNPRLTKTKEEFVKIMNNLNLSYPKQIDKSVPANLVCGILDEMDEKTRKSVLETYKPI